MEVNLIQATPYTGTQSGNWLYLYTLKVELKESVLSILIDGIRVLQKDSNTFFGLPRIKKEDQWVDVVSFPNQQIARDFQNALKEKYTLFLSAQPKAPPQPEEYCLLEECPF